MRGGIGGVFGRLLVEEAREVGRGDFGSSGRGPMNIGDGDDGKEFLGDEGGGNETGSGWPASC